MLFGWFGDVVVVSVEYGCCWLVAVARDEVACSCGNCCPDNMNS